MSWFREWLYGADTPSESSLAGVGTEERPARPEPEPPPLSYPGEHFGLPEHGQDSVATLGRRGGQFALDLLIAGLVSAAIHFPGDWWQSTAVWVVLVLPTVALLGQTPGMMLLGLRVARIDGARRVGPWALARTFSLLFVVPALLLDRDARGLQDRVSRTIVLNSRAR